MTKFLSNWMEYLDGNKLISEFTIPGTHDSGTYRKQNNSVVTCQTLSIEGQLNSGIRFLDIRLNRGYYDDKVLWVYHGTESMNLNFESGVVNVCKNFLQAHSTETIIMSIKDETVTKPYTQKHKEDFANEVWAIIQRAGIFHTSDQLPALDAVRGKIILLRRYWAPLSPYPIGLNCHDQWPDNDIKNFTECGVNYYIQDRFKKWGHKTEKFSKWILKGLEHASFPSSDSKTLYINFSSGVGLTAGILFDSNPHDLANVVNPLFLDYIKLFSKKRYGIIPMDFPELPDKGALIKKLLELNEFNRYVRPDLNGKRLRRISDGAIYLVIDGFLHHITDPATATRLFGKDWGIDSYESPECVAMNEPMPVNAYLVKFEGSDAIYLSYKGDKDSKYMLRHIPNPDVLGKYGLYGNVELKPASQFSSFHVASPLPAPV